LLFFRALSDAESFKNASFWGWAESVANEMYIIELRYIESFFVLTKYRALIMSNPLFEIFVKKMRN